MFTNIKKQVSDNFNSFQVPGVHILYATIDRDQIWETYLMGFKPEDRQSHTCNACKSFLRQYGGIVALVNGEYVSIWDNVVADEEYANSITALQKYIKSLVVDKPFLVPQGECGTDKNLDTKTGVTWEHFSIRVPSKYISSKETIDSKVGIIRTQFETTSRALKELTLKGIDEVLELIADNNLYRGQEVEDKLKAFRKVKKEYDTLVYHTSLKDYNKVLGAYAWKVSLEIPYLSTIRNSSLGTLLVDLSMGISLEEAVRKYEAIMAPANYKRPKSLVTPKMIEEARIDLEKLGYLDSLERRFAKQEDLNTEDVIFLDKSTTVTDPFAELSKDTIVNINKLGKVPEMFIEEFISNVVPTATEIEVLVENSHMPNFVSLITAEDKEAKSFFKWDNNFSWAYSGGVTDSIKERVKAAGGNVEGVLRFSVQWNDEETPGSVDFDAVVIEPDDNRLYYGDDTSTSSGRLDVDMINPTSIGVENIIWTDIKKMPEGEYKIIMKNFNDRRNTGFKAQIEFEGTIFDYHVPTHSPGEVLIAIVTLAKGKFSIVDKLPSSSRQSGGKLKWGISTNKFTKVKAMTLSPNYWGGAVGNKHFMFFLENCINTEDPRPFFNEFLTSELDKSRKVFEMLASKIKVPDSDQQLSGVAFSSTQHNAVFVRITGQGRKTSLLKLII